MRNWINRDNVPLSNVFSLFWFAVDSDDLAIDLERNNTSRGSDAKRFNQLGVVVFVEPAAKWVIVIESLSWALPVCAALVSFMGLVS
jgi:hypothetical protein